MSQSQTDVLHPIMAALMGAEQFLGKGRSWQPLNDQQRIFLERFIENNGDLSGIPEMKTRASYSAEEINAFLRDNGFTITFSEFAEGEFGVASLMKMLVEWLQPGRKGSFTSTFDGKAYPCVFLRQDAEPTFYQLTLADGIPANIVRIPTKSGDSICMMPVGSRKMARVDLTGVVQDIVHTAEPCDDFEGVIFPMVDLDETKGLDWLAGVKTINEAGQPFVVTQAIQQSRLKMNHKGAKMESAMAMRIGTTSMRFPKPPFVIDEPFLFWAERGGLALPYFTAYVSPENWKDPGDLGSV
jgi:hypothetical protein